MFTVCDPIFGDFPVRNTVYTPEIYGSGQPYYMQIHINAHEYTHTHTHTHTHTLRYRSSPRISKVWRLLSATGESTTEDLPTVPDMRVGPELVVQVGIVVSRVSLHVTSVALFSLKLVQQHQLPHPFPILAWLPFPVSQHSIVVSTSFPSTHVTPFSSHHYVASSVIQ